MTLNINIPIPLTAPNADLTFWHGFGFEGPNYDGGVLEISIDGGAFTDILAAGGTFVVGGYNATISTAFGSPIGGRMAWSGTSVGGYIDTIVALPAAASRVFPLRIQPRPWAWRSVWLGCIRAGGGCLCILCAWSPANG